LPALFHATLLRKKQIELLQKLEMVMNDTVKIAIVIASLAVGATGATAAPTVRHAHDPWVSPIHLDSFAVPAKQFFDELERDSE
jgi:hypothetical protein